MKRFLAAFFAVFMIIGNALSVTAAEITDLPADFWASKEAAYCIREGIIGLYEDNTFRPATEVKRAEFNSMLLRTLGHQPAEIKDSKNFKDLNAENPYYSDIMKSEELGLLYGYPDKTFKPEGLITKIEVASIISHITKSSVKDVNILNQFTDANLIPDWAKNQYAKSIELGIYVNYPEPSQLLPEKVLDRAEAAVLFYKLRQAMGEVKEEYVAKEIIMGTEHLRVYPGAKSNQVTVTNYRKIIRTGNVVQANFARNFNSKASEVGQPVIMTFISDVKTEEGSLIIPKGSTLVGAVDTLVPQRKMNKNAKVTLVFHELTFPSGQKLPMSGKVLDNNGILTASKLQTFGKVAGYTLGGAAVGAGAGVAVAAIPNPKNYGTGVAIGIPVAAGIGLATGLLTPGLAYKADIKDALYIELTEDLVLEENL